MVQETVTGLMGDASQPGLGVHQLCYLRQHKHSERKQTESGGTDNSLKITWAINRTEHQTNKQTKTEPPEPRETRGTETSTNNAKQNENIYITPLDPEELPPTP